MDSVPILKTTPLYPGLFLILYLPAVILTYATTSFFHTLLNSFFATTLSLFFANKASRNVKPIVIAIYWQGYIWVEFYIQYSLGLRIAQGDGLFLVYILPHELVDRTQFVNLCQWSLWLRRHFSTHIEMVASKCPKNHFISEKYKRVKIT